MIKKFVFSCFFLISIFVCLTAGSVLAQTTEFTYQGKLSDTVMPQSAAYDFEFRLCASETNCASPLATQARSGVAVSGGVFTVKLDFGAAHFTGADRWLEIAAKRPAEANYTPLLPRQRITSAPYAIRAANATAAAALSAACAACVTDAQIAGVAGSKITGSVANATSATTATTAGNVSGIVAVANGGTGSSVRNFVDLTSTENVGGTKTFTSPVNTSTQYNIGGNRVLSVAGTQNLFAGLNAGTGASNIGFNNTFIGTNAGLNNTTGNQNSFVGASAGGNNTTGSSNSFFGMVAGQSNTVGEYNTVVGSGANLNAGNRVFTTLIGASALATGNDQIVLGKVAGTYFVNGANTSRPADTVLIPGNLVVSGTLTAPIDGAGITNLNANNITSGTLANARLGVVPIVNGGTGSSTQNFVDLTTAQTVAGVKTFSSALNTSSQYNIGGSRVLSVGGSNNLFAGIGAGQSNPTGGFNSFFGRDAGFSNSTGEGNSFIGSSAGFNSTGNNNSLVGRDAGYNNMGGGDNSFFGVSAGFFNSTGNSNSFFGRNAGLNNGTGSNNTAIGQNADFGSDALTFATAIGSGSVVTNSNSVVLGRGADTVRIPGNLVVTGSITGASKSFKIDYPLDPLNKTLTYTSIESPDIKNIYDGNVTTDGGGEATVTLPDYFEALNKDYRYQLTVIGTFAQAIVSDEIKDNSFKIKTDKPGVKVSWQVTGIRRDKFAEDNRAPNVQDKPAAEKGTCLYAPACGAASTDEMRIKPRQ